MEPSSDANTQQSLFGLLRKSIISAISATVALNKWRVVVVDKPSLKIISSVIKMHEILEQNVMSVQLITRSRQPYPDVEAIYILVPCADSVSRMIDDYKSDLEQPTMERSKYARAHLFFTGALPDSLLSLLSQSPAAPYIKGIGELFVEYNPIESRVFLTTPSEQPFYALYSPHSANMIHRDLDAASDRCLSVLALLGIKPYIRYYRPGQPPSTNSVGYPGIAKTMGELLQQKLDDYYSREKITTENKQEQFDDVSPSVVIVLDRSIDMYAPLVHEFTYQAVVHDLIDLEDGTKYAYEIETKTGETRQVSATLGEQTDLLWHQLKHLHIGHVAQVLADQFSKLIEKSSGVKAASEADKKMTMRQMQDAISELPEFNQLREMYSLHMDLASKCLRIINKNELRVLAEFEQELITGKTTAGEPVDRTSVETRLISLLDNQTIDKSDRIRLLFLYLVMVNGGNEVDRRRLEQVPQCLTINDKRAAVNLSQLGIPTAVTEKECTDEGYKELIAKHGKYTWNADTERYGDELYTRFIPAVDSVLRESMANELSTDMFPWVREGPPEGIPKHILNINATSLRRKKGEWGGGHEQRKVSKDKKGGIIIIYIAGGVTLSEMRTVYELAQSYKREIYIGSTHIITPRGFLDDLKSLHLKMLV